MLQQTCFGPCKGIKSGGRTDIDTAAGRACTVCYQDHAPWYTDHHCGCSHFFCTTACMGSYEKNNPQAFESLPRESDAGSPIPQSTLPQAIEYIEGLLRRRLQWNVNENVKGVQEQLAIWNKVKAAALEHDRYWKRTIRLENRAERAIEHLNGEHDG